MIDFFSETDFELKDANSYNQWISNIIEEEGFTLGDINFIFCDDEALHKINLEYLNHDTLTDIISFDYSINKELHGDIYISIDRVKENAEVFQVSFENELSRVLIHGILHFMGHKDKTPFEQQQMRALENQAINKYNPNK